MACAILRLDERRGGHAVLLQMATATEVDASSDDDNQWERTLIKAAEALTISGQQRTLALACIAPDSARWTVGIDLGYRPSDTGEPWLMKELQPTASGDS
uniref:Uncharacterized protein n=1 Tax=Haptolina brevifila TaxID=156173 RepID=A0A6U7NBF0_9EUKA|mmetsp:Transcript_84138/g.167922  ORF Transcript_84138/g.167922 Transcript_84138/m.167922 type:complete len:100 (+) Transcript_84138:1202-1501(+)